MVFGDVTTDDLYTLCVADLADQIPHTGANSSRQYWLLVLHGPDEMVFQIKDRVRA